jgi:hypothetical protein
MNRPTFILPADTRLPEQLEALFHDEMEEFATKCLLAGFEQGLCACHGSEVGGAVFASLMGTATRPNTELAPSVSRAWVSKAINRVRRHLGIPIENPAKAHGRGVEAQRKKREQATLATVAPRAPATAD